MPAVQSAGEWIEKVGVIPTRAQDIVTRIGFRVSAIQSQWRGLVEAGGGRDDHAASLLKVLEPELRELQRFAVRCIEQIDAIEANPFGE